MKSSASESKPLQSRSRAEIPGQARRKERLGHSKLKEPFFIDSDPELFMYLIQGIRFGSWKKKRKIGVWTGPKKWNILLLSARLNSSYGFPNLFAF